jgi:oxygen-independent coproporphyrinogen-3 oxidase
VDGLVEAGINRVSIGMQSSVEAELLVLDREHKFDRVAEAVRVCREAGLENISLDLIYGIPGQTLASWKKSLLNALSLNPEHLSLYGLTIEDGTMLAHRVNRGIVEYPDEDLAADQYEWAMGHLSDQGFNHYEISNWGRSKLGSVEPSISRHNQQYWMNNPYLGVGAGAHGFFSHERIKNIPELVKYLEHLSGTGNRNLGRFPAAASVESITRERDMQETMMMGLRLLDRGVSEDRFRDRFGTGIEDIFAAELRKLIGLGLIEWATEGEKKRLRLTRQAILIANQVFREFV